MYTMHITLASGRGHQKRHSLRNRHGGRRKARNIGRVMMNLALFNVRLTKRAVEEKPIITPQCTYILLRRVATTIVECPFLLEPALEEFCPYVCTVRANGSPLVRMISSAFTTDSWERVHCLGSFHECWTDCNVLWGYSAGLL